MLYEGDSVRQSVNQLVTSWFQFNAHHAVKLMCELRHHEVSATVLWSIFCRGVWVDANVMEVLLRNIEV